MDDVVVVMQWKGDVGRFIDLLRSDRVHDLPSNEADDEGNGDDNICGQGGHRVFLYSVKKGVSLVPLASRCHMFFEETFTC